MSAKMVAAKTVLIPCNVRSLYSVWSIRASIFLLIELISSCSVPARLALLNLKGIEFDKVEEPFETRHIISKTLYTHDQRIQHKPQRYLWKLRILTIQVLQNREHRLTEQLIILGMFYNNLQEQITNQTTHDTPQLIVRTPIGWLADQRIIKGISSQRYIECFTEFLHGIEYMYEATVEEIAQRYQESYESKMSHS